MKTSCTLWNTRRKKNGGLCFRAIQCRGAVLPSLCLPHWKQDRATGLCEPYFLHLGPLKSEPIKSSKVGENTFSHQNQSYLWWVRCRNYTQPSSIFLSTLPSLQAHMRTIRLDPHPASLAMPQKSSTSKEERELHLLSVSHVPSSLITFIWHHPGRQDINIFWGGSWTKPAQSKTGEMVAMESNPFSLQAVPF